MIQALVKSDKVIFSKINMPEVQYEMNFILCIPKTVKVHILQVMQLNDKT